MQPGIASCRSLEFAQVTKSLGMPFPIIPWLFPIEPLPLTIDALVANYKSLWQTMYA
jgi:hypothetical protein